VLAVNSDKYCLPVRIKDEDGEVTWKLYSDADLSDCGYLVAAFFNYTCVSSGTKATFKYSGGSVKPSARTLRIYGAEVLQSVVRDLATNKDPRRNGRDIVDKLDYELARPIREKNSLSRNVDDDDDDDGWG